MVLASAFATREPWRCGISICSVQFISIPLYFANLRSPRADDALALKIEPHAPSSDQRFEAMAKLSKAGLFTGKFADAGLCRGLRTTARNIRQILMKAKEAGLSLSMRLRHDDAGSSAGYYYQCLDEQFPGLKKSISADTAVVTAVPARSLTNSKR